ncbi:NADH-quinone dehydrogenase [Arenicella sp. 4NH20-0111]|uniref:NAD(P)/FAD-dependent oxidoreductase n=1 Tax=Arenicella sp. 4NH20-0111 TaxID=3127648 RepID=UPI0031085E43
MQTEIKPHKAVPHIVIVGGGAGGLELATTLGNKLGKKQKAKITLIDKHRVHIWKPLLHEVATGSLDTEIDGVVYRAHAKRHHYQFQLGQLVDLDRESKRLSFAPILDDEENEVVEERQIGYDTLVLAIGSISNDFGTPGVQEFCSLLDSKHQAQRFQQKLLNLFLKKSSTTESAEDPIRLAIVGAGATGVELSAELNHVVDVVSVYDNMTEGKTSLSIDLIEAGERILPALPERIAESATAELEKLGVRVRTNTRITEANQNGFVNDSGELIEADLMVWAAGVKAESWLSVVGLKTNRINQVECFRTLKSLSDPSIYAIGDCCHVEMEEGGKVPPRAQSAHQMASTVAKNIVRELSGKDLVEFKYTDYGSLVNLARFSTVGSLMGNLVKGSMFIEGKIARLMYLSLYRMHQLSIHGFIKGPFVILLSQISKIIRPKIKLH